ENEVAAYAQIRRDGLTFAAKFQGKLGRKVFDLSLIYPLKDDRLAQSLLSLQPRLGDILGDSMRNQGHFYPSAKSFHLTLLHHTMKSPLLSEAHRQDFRNKAMDLFFNEDQLLVKPRIHFFGGSVGIDAVIIHGYNFASLNQSRLALARYGMRHQLFDRNISREYAWQIISHDLVSPNIAHLGLLRLGRAITLEERLRINALLNNVNFGETTFSEVGLYELSRWGIFSPDNWLAHQVLP
ncbi:hypothetical protein NO2_1436, partial [Candidatus Termititenax persephonae]